MGGLVYVACSMQHSCSCDPSRVGQRVGLRQSAESLLCDWGLP